ncbi:restriction endonuclease subunit S [Halomonas sp. MMSF_3323]|uniref:restriction endonuclease subunit S n=1 Tax=Halomonas sp. MMSF_3323 TaxID=3046701 RepID=UPI00273E788B|nr:restriction endonuclease subunit S [Halomonas sp. MMSF_3323]
MNWSIVKLAEVASIERKGINPSAIESGTNYLGLENIESGGRIIERQKVLNGDLASTKFSFGPEHILYGKLRPYLAKIALPDFEGVCSTDIVPIKPGPRIDRRFLAYFLRQPSMVKFASSRSTGANLPRLSPKTIADFDVPLPRLEEQKRIATILDHANQVYTLRQHAIKKLNDLRLSLFLEIFDRELESGEFDTLGELTEEFRYGTSNKSSAEGAPTLRIPNVVAGDINLSDLKKVNVTKKELDRLSLRTNDLLFVRTNGNPTYVGRSAVVPKKIKNSEHEISEFIFASYLIRARLKNPAISAFIHSYLESPSGRKQLLDNARTSAGQYNINTKALGSIKIPKAGNAKIADYANSLVALEEQKSSYENHNRHLKELILSLQQHAFRREL